MLLNIYSLRKPVLRKEVQSVNLKTKVGEITILNNHRPLVVPLVKGQIRVVDLKGEETAFPSEGGLVEVRPDNKVSILLN